MTDFRSKTFLADWIRRNTPTRDGLAQISWLKPIAHRFLSPELWRFTRRSVPRGIALGLFSAFIVPLGQIFLAAFLALPARANVPVAVLVTFVTNPFTYPFWVVAANRVGAFLLTVDRSMGGAAHAEMKSGRWTDVMWWVNGVGATAFGFFVLAVVSAALGYLIGSFFWRRRVGRKRTRRLAARKRLKAAKLRKKTEITET